MSAEEGHIERRWEKFRVEYDKLNDMRLRLESDAMVIFPRITKLWMCAYRDERRTFSSDDDNCCC